MVANTQSTHTLRFQTDTVALKQQLDRADKELRELATEFDRAAASARRLQTASVATARGVTTSGKSMNKQMKANFTNFGFQVQDIVVQAEMGTDALRIFAQQGTQIAGIFGPWAAIASAAAAGIAILAKNFVDLESDSSKAAAAMEALTEATEGYLDALEDRRSLVDEFRDGLAGAEAIANQRQMNIEMMRTKEALDAITGAFEGALRQQKGDINWFTPTYGRELGKAYEIALKQIQDGILSIENANMVMNKSFGLTFNEVSNILLAIDRLAEAPGLEEQVTAMDAILELAFQYKDTLGLTTQQLDDMNAAYEAMRGQLEATTTGADRLEAAAEMTAYWTRQASEYMLFLNQRAAAAADELSRIPGPGQGSSDAARDSTAATYGGIAGLRRDQFTTTVTTGKTSGGGSASNPAKDAADAAAEAARKAKEEFEKWREEMLLTDDLLEYGLTSGVDGFVDAITDAEASFSEFARTFLRDISRMILKQAILNMISGAFGGPTSNATPDSILQSAMGAGLPRLASGGVVGNPTVYRGAIIGEAGPEAVMPLQRSPDGRLGVGASMPAITINNNVGNADVQIVRADERTIEIAVTSARQAVASDFARSMQTGQGAYARSLESGYGTRRRNG